MKKAYDSYHQEREFSIRGWVFLMLRPYKQMSLVKWKNFKLSPRYYGHFKVLDRIGKVAYKLDLPITSRLYSIFHVSVPKNQIGENHIVLRELPVQEDEDSTKLFPQAVFGFKIEKWKEWNLNLLKSFSGWCNLGRTWNNSRMLSWFHPWGQGCKLRGGRAVMTCLWLSPSSYNWIPFISFLILFNVQVCFAFFFLFLFS